MALSAFLLSCLMAFIAGHMVNYSIIFLALERFDSHALAGIGYGLCFGPPLILGWFAGVFCDKYSPRKVILVAQNSFFVSITLLYFSLKAPVEYQQNLLLVAALFSGVGWSFVAPARFATLPYYVKANKLSGAAIALNLMVMAGFGLAPMILKQINVNYGWSTVLSVAASLFLLSSLLLIPLRFTFTAKATDKVIQELKNSYHFVKQSSVIKSLLLLSSIVYLLMGPMQVILPSVAKNTLALSETGQGYYLSLIALALIMGGIIAMVLKNKGHIGVTLLFTIIGTGVGIGLVSSETDLTLSVILLFLTATCGGIAVSFIVAGLQSFSAPQYRGRIMSFYSIISQIVPAFSGIFAGLVAQWLSPEAALQIIALLIVSCAMVCFFLLKSIRRLTHFSESPTERPEHA